MTALESHYGVRISLYYAVKLKNCEKKSREEDKEEVNKKNKKKH
jgi:hypothetical protein